MSLECSGFDDFYVYLFHSDTFRNAVFRTSWNKGKKCRWNLLHHDYIRKYINVFKVFFILITTFKMLSNKESVIPFKRVFVAFLISIESLISKEIYSLKCSADRHIAKHDLLIFNDNADVSTRLRALLSWNRECDMRLTPKARTLSSRVKSCSRRNIAIP